MRKPQGYVTITSEDGVVEKDAFTCSHCCKVVEVPPMTDPATLGGFCYGCGKMICPQCVATGKCDPIEKKLERMEASYHARRSYGI